MGKDQELVQAVKNEDIATVQRLLNRCKAGRAKLLGTTKKPNVNFQDTDGFSALHHAALMGNSELISLLLDAQAAVDLRDNKGMRALHLAAWQGKAEPSLLLLRAGASVNAQSEEGEIPLHLSAQHGHHQVSEMLLQHQSNACIVNSANKTPLDMACEFGRVKVAQLLLSSNMCSALLEGKSSDITEPNSTTPLHLAAKNGHKDIIRLLLNAGIDINRQTRSGTALHEASLYGKTEVVRLLIDAGVNVHIRNTYNQTALDIVNQFTGSQASKEIKQMLREASAVLQVRAVKDFSNVYDPESLTVKAGDTITVVGQHLDGRWKGVVQEARGSDRVGFFPPTIAEVINRRTAHVSPMKCRHPPQPVAVGAGNHGNPKSPSIPCCVANGNTAVRPGSPSIQRVADGGGSAQPSPSSSEDIWVLRRPLSGDRRSSGSTGSAVSVRSSGSGQSMGSANGPPPPLVGPTEGSKGCLLGVPQPSPLLSPAVNEHGEPSSGAGRAHGAGGVPVCEQPQGDLTKRPHHVLEGKDAEAIFQWLSDFQLQQYASNFISAGYDVPTISRMTPEDLTAIGVTKPGHRKKISVEIGKLSIPEWLPDYKPAELGEWLSMIGLSQYQRLLVESGYDSVEFITDITWEDLQEIGITKLGHQKKLMLAVRKLLELQRAERAASGDANSPERRPPRRVRLASTSQDSGESQDGRSGRAGGARRASSPRVGRSGTEGALPEDPPSSPSSSSATLPGGKSTGMQGKPRSCGGGGGGASPYKAFTPPQTPTRSRPASPLVRAATGGAQLGHRSPERPQTPPPASGAAAPRLQSQRSLPQSPTRKGFAYVPAQHLEGGVALVTTGRLAQPQPQLQPQPPPPPPLLPPPPGAQALPLLRLPAQGAEEELGGAEGGWRAGVAEPSEQLLGEQQAHCLDLATAALHQQQQRVSRSQSARAGQCGGGGGAGGVGIGVGGLGGGTVDRNVNRSQSFAVRPKKKGPPPPPPKRYSSAITSTQFGDTFERDRAAEAVAMIAPRGEADGPAAAAADSSEDSGIETASAGSVRSIAAKLEMTSLGGRGRGLRPGLLQKPLRVDKPSPAAVAALAVPPVAIARPLVAREGGSDAEQQQRHRAKAVGVRRERSGDRPPPYETATLPRVSRLSSRSSVDSEDTLSLMHAIKPLPTASLSIDEPNNHVAAAAAGVVVGTAALTVAPSSSEGGGSRKRTLSDSRSHSLKEASPIKEALQQQQHKDEAKSDTEEEETAVAASLGGPAALAERSPASSQNSSSECIPFAEEGNLTIKQRPKPKPSEDDDDEDGSAVFAETERAPPPPAAGGQAEEELAAGSPDSESECAGLPEFYLIESDTVKRRPKSKDQREQPQQPQQQQQQLLRARKSSGGGGEVVERALADCAVDRSAMSGGKPARQRPYTIAEAGAGAEAATTTTPPSHMSGARTDSALASHAAPAAGSPGARAADLLGGAVAEPGRHGADAGGGRPPKPPLSPKPALASHALKRLGPPAPPKKTSLLASPEFRRKGVPPPVAPKPPLALRAGVTGWSAGTHQSVPAGQQQQQPQQPQQQQKQQQQQQQPSSTSGDTGASPSPNKPTPRPSSSPPSAASSPARAGQMVPSVVAPGNPPGAAETPSSQAPAKPAREGEAVPDAEVARAAEVGAEPGKSGARATADDGERARMGSAGDGAAAAAAAAVTATAPSENSRDATAIATKLAPGDLAQQPSARDGTGEANHSGKTPTRLELSRDAPSLEERIEQLQRPDDASGEQKSTGSILDDIGTMFDDLADELDAMLE
ncbi:caskin-1-like isoform X2 [Lethenteron reissneri]|uniref:caskin-1-like isoform X2 n=1 Tax=Lethenteron reissneri TaxID=7753 RepID=UPI002AB6EF6C|nr:caskin-1-like isoform X2 [Lethenteron reissneri]